MAKWIVTRERRTGTTSHTCGDIRIEESGPDYFFAYQGEKRLATYWRVLALAKRDLAKTFRLQ